MTCGARRNACVSVHVQEDAEAPLRRYGLEQLLRMSGVRYDFGTFSEPTVYCGSEPRLGRRAAVWISAETGNAAGRHRREHEHLVLVEIQGVPVPVPAGGHPPHDLWTGNQLMFDVAKAASFFLALTSEEYAARRDRHGRVPAEASLLGRSGWLNRPPVMVYARLLAERLRSCGVLGEPVPLWPKGKKYAVALTHDVDAPERRGRCSSLLKKMLFGGRPARKIAYWELRSEVRVRGLREACLYPATLRKEWDFANVCAVESAVGLRSAFYFAMANRAEGHPCDVDYDASLPRYRRLYRRLAAGGWEVGLHVAYLTYLDCPSAEIQYRRFAALAGAGPAGVRHHCLQLGAEEPLRMLGTHADAGAVYDTSGGFNDEPGFRFGTALPFEPFDPRRSAASRLLELPMTIADMHLLPDDTETTVEATLGHLRCVRELEGLAVLNWHVGTWHVAPAWRESYHALCRFIAEDTDAWVATPREVAAWWRLRGTSLKATA